MRYNSNDYSVTERLRHRVVSAHNMALDKKHTDWLGIIGLVRPFTEEESGRAKIMYIETYGSLPEFNEGCGIENCRVCIEQKQ